jgi:hypothetical protein
MRILILLTFLLTGTNSVADVSFDKELIYLSQKNDPTSNDRIRFDSLLNKVSTTNIALYHFIVGETYYFGVYRERNVRLAVDNLMSSLKIDSLNARANYLLGTIYAVESEFFDKNKAIKYLNFSADCGDVDAINNLYHLYQRKWLDRAEIFPHLVAHKGNSDDIALAYAQEQLAICSENMTNTCMVDLSDFISNHKFKSGLDEAMLLLAKIYSSTGLPIFDANKRDYYLKKSAELGNKEAIRILDDFNRYLENNQITK